jgi:hypothetical protein
MSALLLLAIVILILIVINLIRLTGVVRLSFTRTHQVMAVYLVLLLASLTVFYTMAESRQKGPLPVPEKGMEERDWEEFERLLSDYYDAFFEGRVEEYEGAELAKKWDFDYTGKRLLLKTADGRQYYGSIFIAEKAEDDRKVEARYYIISRDYQDSFPVNLPEMRLAGEVLEIILPERTEIRAVRFVQDFTSAQFTGKGLTMDSDFYFYHGDHQVLYLKVPWDLQVDTDESTKHHVTFTGK